MKRICVSALLVCALTMPVAVSAQQVEKRDCPKREKKECVTPRCDMAKELNLTPEQQEKMKASREEFTKTRTASKEAVKAAREKHQAEMKEILTPEQQAKMKEMRPAKRGNKEMRHHRGHRGHKHMVCDSMRNNRPCDVKRAECPKEVKPCAKSDAGCCPLVDKKNK